MVDLNFDEFFKCSPHRGTRGHKYELYKKSPGTRRTRIRSEFFSERVINVWNQLSVATDFSTVTSFKGSILNTDFSDYLYILTMSCSVVHLFVFCVFFLYITRDSYKRTMCLAVQSHVTAWF